jgi:hypothetical protein
MDTETLQEFYQSLGFEEITVEDGYTAFFYELSPEGMYALVTDEDGAIPQTLKQRVIFAAYSPEGAFRWSTGFKNSYLLKECWETAQTAEGKFAAVENLLKD